MKSKFSITHRCRLCGREESNLKLRNIFEKSQELELEIKIAKLLPVVVMPWDPLPHKICFSCIEKLNLFNDFYNDTIKADEFLRKFFPTAPENEVENRDPIIEINDCAGVVNKVFKIQSKNIQSNSQKPISTNVINKDVLENSVNKIFPVNQLFDNITEEKSLESFIINTISTTDSVYTCRKCFRTFTKQSAALSHACSKIANFEKQEKVGNVIPEKSLPPLKIRLYSTVANKFVCDLCQKLFVKKANVVKHIKGHFLNRGTKENNNKKVDHKKRNKKNLENCGRKTVSQLLPEFSSYNQLSNVNQKSFSCDSPVNNTAEEVVELPDKSSSNLVTNSHEIKHKKPKVSNNKPKESPAEKTLVRDCSFGKETERSRYPCVFCDKVFSGKKFLLKHQETHLKNCQENWAKFFKLERKRNITNSAGKKNKSVSKKKIFICKICKMSFTRKKVLINHEKCHEVDWNLLEQPAEFPQLFVNDV